MEQCRRAAKEARKEARRQAAPILSPEERADRRRQAIAARCRDAAMAKQPATLAQAALIRKLLAERNVPARERRDARTRLGAGQLSALGASAWIDRLIAMPPKLAPDHPDTEAVQRAIRRVLDHPDPPQE
jgi:hypothetical protein